MVANVDRMFRVNADGCANRCSDLLDALFDVANMIASQRCDPEEIFGPVLTVARFSREEEAAALANGTDYSLAAAVWTRDLDRALRMTEALRAGTVWVNTYGPTDARLPWGGMGGQSGFGRDLGRSAIENYTDQKTVWIRRAAAA
jgi:aldehyde dehydrogenase (NAD+)